MNREPHDCATSNILAWTSQCANVETSAEEDAAAEADEPPDRPPPLLPLSNHFKRAPVRRGSEHHESLLTKALQSQSEEETCDGNSLYKARRRRSITSNFSLASTTELTCDTGISTPARTNSPSPRFPEVGFVPLTAKSCNGVCFAASPVRQPKLESVAGIEQRSKDSAVQVLEKKRCISFACAAKPQPDDKALLPPPPKPASAAQNPLVVQEPIKRLCIKFACPARPMRNAPTDQPEPLASTPVPKKSTDAPKEDSSSRTQKNRSPSAARSMRSLTPRRSSQSPVAVRTTKKFISADSKELQSEGARFHEFASDEPQEDDWIRRDATSPKRKLTIDDTLEKENAIRKLGKEAEEEAELEEAIDDDEDEEENADGDDMDDEQNGDYLDLDDDYSGYGSDDDASDGYNTDEEVGFADSDDEDDGLVLWTTSGMGQLFVSGVTAVHRRASVVELDASDSSSRSKRDAGTVRVNPRRKPSNIVFRPGTPELPDSTDFVCGTLDEDRPMEEAYMSCIAARKREKQHVIPQDIDPSFPTSEPEDEENELYEHGHGDSDDQVWLHGELEDIHHEQDRAGRKKSEHQSPKRYHSPPPKRLHSPPPKARGRSPRRLFDRQSPRRFKSPPPPQPTHSPPASPVQAGKGIAFKSLAVRPGLTHTKSLPRAPALFPHRGRRGRAGTVTRENHVRGAIDIVKGLEQKRQRRKEKFYQKYCNRARKEKAQERRPPPGQGAERMREIGLKIGQGNYVISY